jgi:hypothetical protein
MIYRKFFTQNFIMQFSVFFEQPVNSSSNRVTGKWSLEIANVRYM